MAERIFIDEIGDFELGLQSKLLRVLETLTVTPVGGHEDRKVNVRRAGGDQPGHPAHGSGRHV